MEGKKGKILWVDDEIELLRSHILFLEERGYDVTPVTNAEDALLLIEQETFDLVLLDEMLNGKDGLTALGEIKDKNPSLPVVMVTKSEEESLMEEAIGSKIDDYLTKPVNPSQVLSTCKKILEQKRIERDRLSREYIAEFNKVSRMLLEPLDWRSWLEVYRNLCQWEVELDHHPDLGLRQTLLDQKRECNAEFAKFVERHYPAWISLDERPSDDAPPLSVDLVRLHLAPLLREERRVVFVVMDNLRLDQWLTLEPLLYTDFRISREYYYSILPTATPYARNAIFSGLFPNEIEKQHPDLWQRSEEDEFSMNRFERQFLDFQLKRLGIELRPEAKYIKILDVNEARSLENKINSYSNIPLLSIVLNFVDILAHSRSDSEVLKEITPDESAYRALTRSWFEHSTIYRIIREFGRRGYTVVLTSDHGSIRGMRGAKVIGDRETSTNLRYKFGRSIKAESRYAITINDPATYKLPARGINTNYLIAKEDYYFVYPTNYHHYLNYYRDSLQHGGVSLEEMVLPVAILEPKAVA
jgi:CheY-like chemotaxis protein